MSDPVYVGLAVAATSSNDASTAVFENLTLTAGPVAPKGYVATETEELPSSPPLEQNAPNPFNPTTRIRYSIQTPGMVRVMVFDALGRQVEELVNEYRDAGLSEVYFDASGLPSGIYFYTLETGSSFITQKMTLLK